MESKKYLKYTISRGFICTLRNETQVCYTSICDMIYDSICLYLRHIYLPGGLGDMDIPIISDLTRQISRDYGVMLEDEGHTLRGLFIIDDRGIITL